MTEPSESDLRRLAQVMAEAQDLTLTEDNEPGVVMHLAVAFRMAPLVLDFPLPDEAEPAAIFTA